MAHTPKEPDWALLAPKKRFLVAFSGGVDSSFLLWEMVSQFGSEACVAVYFDHGLRSPSVQACERKIIQKTAATVGVRLIIRRLPMTAYMRKYSVSTEEAGRYLRYDLLAHFKKTMHCDAIVTAHHQDDSAESFLMQLGAGALLGTQGIRPHTLWRQSHDIYHPLWHYTKTEIVTAFHHSELSHSEDITNIDTTILRNKVRHRLLPEAEKTFPNFSEKAIRFGNFMAQMSTYIADKIPKTLTAFCYESRGGCSASGDPQDAVAKVDLSDFTELANIEKEWVARHWLINHAPLSRCRIGRPHLRFSESHIAALIDVASKKKPRTSLPGNRMAWHEYGFLYFAVQPEEKQEEDVFPPQSFLLKEGVIHFRDIGLSLEITKESYTVDTWFPEKWKKPWIACLNDAAVAEATSMSIRAREPGDTFQPIGMPTIVSLKKYFINKKMPARWRGHLPLFFIESELVWVPFLGLANRYKTECSAAASDKFPDKKNTLWVLTLSPTDTRFQPVFNHYNWM